MYLRALAGSEFLLASLFCKNDLAAAVFVDVMKYVLHLLAGIVLGLHVNDSALALAAIKAAQPETDLYLIPPLPGHSDI